MFYSASDEETQSLVPRDVEGISVSSSTSFQHRIPGSVSSYQSADCSPGVDISIISNVSALSEDEEQSQNVQPTSDSPSRPSSLDSSSTCVMPERLPGGEGQSSDPDGDTGSSHFSPTPQSDLHSGPEQFPPEESIHQESLCEVAPSSWLEDPTDAGALSTGGMAVDVVELMSSSDEQSLDGEQPVCPNHSMPSQSPPGYVADYGTSQPCTIVEINSSVTQSLSQVVSFTAADESTATMSPPDCTFYEQISPTAAAEVTEVIAEPTSGLCVSKVSSFLVEM